MRIAYDVTIAGVNAEGTGRYTSSLGQALSARLGGAFVPIASALVPLLRRGGVARRLAWWGGLIYWWPEGAAMAARRVGATVLHIPAGLGPVRPIRKPTFVVTIHDALVVTHPELFPGRFAAYGRFALPRVAAVAHHIITPSDAARHQIIEALGVPESRVTVIGEGVEPIFRPSTAAGDDFAGLRARYALPPRFVLAVGTIEPRKNMPRLIRAVHRARANTGCGDLTLVHVGPPGWLSDDVPRTLAELRLGDAVRLLGFVDRSDLPRFYQLATALAYPSLAEGFGLPVLEAMACGCPVVTSDTSSLVEVAGGAALLVDPTSVDAIADAMARCWTDDRLRADLATRGLTRAATFSWDRAAAQTVDAYRAAGL